MDKYHVRYDNMNAPEYAYSVIVDRSINYETERCCYFYARNLSHETAKEIAEAMNAKERRK